MALPGNQTTPPSEAPSSEAASPPSQTAPQAAPAKKTDAKKIIIWAVIIILLLAALYFLFKAYLTPGPADDSNTVNVNQPAASAPETNAAAEPEATTTLAVKSVKAVASSENFDLLQINLEGSGTNVFDFAENEILTISSVKSELYTAKEGEKSEIRALISCQTNKRSYAEVEYLKSGEKDKKIIKDTYLGFNHIIVIPALDPDSVYKYSINAVDANQASVISEQYVFYTGVGNISLVDILSGAVQKVFGWAIGD